MCREGDVYEIEEDANCHHGGGSRFCDASPDGSPSIYGGVVNVFAEGELTNFTYFLYKPADEGSQIGLYTKENGEYKTVTGASGISFSENTLTISDDLTADIVIASTVSNATSISIASGKTLNGSITNESGQSVTINNSGTITGRVIAISGPLTLTGDGMYNDTIGYANTAKITITSGKFHYNPLEKSEGETSIALASGSYLATYKTEYSDMGYAAVNAEYPYEIYTSGSTVNFPEIEKPEDYGIAKNDNGTWFKKVEEGTESAVTTDTINANTTYTKKWTNHTILLLENGNESSEHYSIKTGEDANVAYSDDNGVVAGTKVTIVPNPGYKFSTAPSIGGQNTSTTASPVENSDNYTFTMPDEKIFVHGVVTESKPVAKIGDTRYATLKAAFDAAKDGDTINLVSNVTMTEKITINKSVTLNAAYHTITGVSDNADVNFEITGGTFTVKDGTFTGFGDKITTVDKAAVFKIPSTASNARIEATIVTVKNFNRAAFDVRSGSFKLTDCQIDCDNGQDQRLTKGVVAGYDTAAVTGTLSYCRINGAKSDYKGWSASAIEVSAGATVDVTDCYINDSDGGISVALNYGQGKASVTVNRKNRGNDPEGFIDARKYAVRIYEKNAVEGSSAEVTLNAGKYNAPVYRSVADVNNPGDKGKFIINGGYFNGSQLTDSDVAEGKTVVASDKTGYDQMVVDKKVTSAEVKAADPEVNTKSATATGEKAGEVKEAVAKAIGDKSPEITGTALTDAANIIANNDDTDKTAAVKELETVVSTASDANIHIVIQPYFDIELKKVEANDTEKSFTLDITPKYRKVATTADPKQSDAEILTENEGETNANAVVLEDNKDLTVNNSVDITIPLPSDFTTETKLYVTHVKESGASYVYTGTVNTESEKKSLTFTNPNGFSEFTVSTENPAVARIGDVYYGSLQTAVDDVPNVGTITLTKNAGKAVVNNMWWQFSVDATDNKFEATLEAAPGVRMESSKTGNVTTYTTWPKPIPGGGGSSVTPTPTPTPSTDAADKFTDVAKDSIYRDAIAWAVENKITDGTSSTTFSPKKVCTRAEIVTFLYRLAGSPKVNAVAKFGDVSADNYFANAVAWAVENGITVGTSDTTFSPNQSCTRAEAMTFLYRYEKSPAATGSSKFVDVKDGAYYENSVAWGVQNGITNGTSDTTFSPEQSCTREQIVTFLYRDATKK